MAGTRGKREVLFSATSLNNSRAVPPIGSVEDKISAIFQSAAALEAEALTAMLRLWKHRRTLKRNDFLARAGLVESGLFFVEAGALRIYFPNDRDEVSVGFSYTGQLICSYPSFILQKPSAYYIQALSRTELVYISRQDFYGLFERYRSIERCWRILEEQALLGKIEREAEMLAYTPEQRYERLLQRSPHIFQLIPKKYIASYLRMTPETMSRIGAGNRSSAG